MLARRLSYRRSSRLADRLTVALAKVAYIQLRRMFEEILIGASPPPTPSGMPLYTLDTRVEVTCASSPIPIGLAHRLPAPV